MKSDQNKQEVNTETKRNSSQNIQPEKKQVNENDEKIKKPSNEPVHEKEKNEVEIPEKDHEHGFKEPFGKTPDSRQNKNINKTDPKPISGEPLNQNPNNLPPVK